MTSLIANIVKASAVCTVIEGDALARLRELPSESVNCCVTSPPYWGLRDYKVEGQIGLEKTPDEYIARMVDVFREVRRVLRPDGTCWINLGDSYAGGGNNRGNESPISEKQGSNSGATGQVGVRPIPCGLKPKDICGIPWRVAFALQADGWWLRQDIIWHKPNPMPESVTDRCTKAHEYVFLLAKSERYYYDAEAIKEPANESNWRDSPCGRRDPPPGQSTDTGFLNGRYYTTRNKRSVWTVPEDEYQQFVEWKRLHSRDHKDVWTVPTAPYAEAHFATFPPNLIRPCVLAGCPVGGTVLDPFAGSGTTGQVALEEGRNALLIELNPAYIALIRKRCHL